jgi:hypothetical protein
MTAPTEAEIRADVVSFLESPSPMGLSSMRDALRSVVRDIADTIDVPAFNALESDRDVGDDESHDALWRDLRRSEARRLRELVTAAIDRATERCEAIILDEVTAPGIAFAKEFPEAPRPSN